MTQIANAMIMIIKEGTHVAVFLLNEFEEGVHVGSAEVVDRFEAGEHAPLTETLEVVLANVLK